MEETAAIDCVGGGVASAEVAPGEIRNRYEIRDEEVLPFLRANPLLVPILREIADEVPRAFGPDAALALALVRDPEDGAAGEPFVFVRTALPPGEALARLRRFDEGWWLRRLASGGGQLTVTLEYA